MRTNVLYTFLGTFAVTSLILSKYSTSFEKFWVCDQSCDLLNFVKTVNIVRIKEVLQQKFYIQYLDFFGVFWKSITLKKKKMRFGAYISREV